VDQAAPRAIAIDLVAAGLAACKLGRVHRPKAIATVINL
jgi:hypothetical protein